MKIRRKHIYHCFHGSNKFHTANDDTVHTGPESREDLRQKLIMNKKISEQV